MKYTKQHDEWLTHNLESGEYKELAIMFNELFGTKINGEALRHRAQRLGLKKQYNSSRCKRGEVLNKKAILPIGTERIADGIVWVKVEDVRSRYNKKKPGGYQNGGNWRKKAYINWERKYGCIPNGKRLIYLDGNSLNCDVENLYFADVGVQMHISRHKMLTGNRELTLAAIKRYELIVAVRNVLGSEFEAAYKRSKSDG